MDRPKSSPKTIATISEETPEFGLQDGFGHVVQRYIFVNPLIDLAVIWLRLLAHYLLVPAILLLMVALIRGWHLIDIATFVVDWAQWIESQPIERWGERALLPLSLKPEPLISAPYSQTPAPLLPVLSTSTPPVSLPPSNPQLHLPSSLSPLPSPHHPLLTAPHRLPAVPGFILSLKGVLPLVMIPVLSMATVKAWIGGLSLVLKGSDRGLQHNVMLLGIAVSSARAYAGGVWSAAAHAATMVVWLGVWKFQVEADMVAVPGAGRR